MSETPEEPKRSLADRIAEKLPELGRHVRRRMGPELRERESASDIVQSTAREVLRSGRFEDRGEGSLQSYLRAAAEHKIQNRLRYWRVLGRGGEASVGVESRAHDSGPRPSEEAVLREETALLEEALGALTEEHRYVIRRVRLEGASYEVVAVELGRTPEAVRKLLARALGRLSSFLRD